MTTSWTRVLLAGSIFVALASLAGPARTSLSAQDGTQSWTKVMYMGGAVGVRGKSTDWDSTLTVSPRSISLTRKSVDGPIFDIDPSSVTEVTYTGDQRRNEGAVAAGGVLAGVFVKSKDHYLTLDFDAPGGVKAAVLLRLDKGTAEEIIDAVLAATNTSR